MNNEQPTTNMDKNGTKGYPYHVFNKENGMWLWDQDQASVIDDSFEITNVPVPQDGLNHAFDVTSQVWHSYDQQEWADYLLAHIQTVETPDANQLRLNQVIGMIATQQVDISTIKADITEIKTNLNLNKEN